ncbi:MAG: hypothetical protein WBA76_20685, partial [Phormidesmis sp.]
MKPPTARTTGNPTNPTATPPPPHSHPNARSLHRPYTITAPNLAPHHNRRQQAVFCCLPICQPSPNRNRSKPCYHGHSRSRRLCPVGGVAIAL